MANQHPPSPQASWVDGSGRPTPEFFRFIDDLSQGVTPPPPAPPPPSTSQTTTSPLYAAQFGLTLQPVGEQIIHLPNPPWMLRCDDTFLYHGSLGVTPVLLYQTDPVLGAINKTINVGLTNVNEIRGIKVFGAYVYFVDRAAAKLYKVRRSDFTLAGTLTGFPATGSGQPGPFCIDADLASLYIGVTIVGASLLLKLDPTLIPEDGRVVSYTTALYPRGPNTLNLGGDDTHNLCWDGALSVWVTNISSNNVIYRVNKETMTVTTAFPTISGQWGVVSNGDHVAWTEISADLLTQRPLGAISHGATFALPAVAGAADIQFVDDEIWMAFSTLTMASGFWVGSGTNPNAPNTIGAVGVYDALTGAQKRVMDNGGGHCASVCPFGPDVWSTDAAGQFLRRWRRKTNFFAPLS